VIDEDGLPAFDHPAHAAVEGANLNNTLDHLDGAALLIDDDGECRSLYDRRKHRRIDREVRDAGVLDLEQQSAEGLDDPGEAGRLGGRGEPKFASRSDDDVITSADQCSPTGGTGQQGIARGELGVHLDRGRLEAGVHNSRVAAQLSNHPFVLACRCSACGGADQEKKRDEHQGEFVHGSHSFALNPSVN